MLQKIDWPNHFIAFLSAMLGILIAFQLEDYQENKQKEEDLEIALDAVNTEIQNNLNIYERNVSVLSEWLEYFDWHGQINEKGILTLGKEQYEEMVNKSYSKARFSEWEVVEEFGDSLLVNVSSGGLIIDVLPEAGVSTSSWLAASNSGVINRLGNQKLTQLTKMYQWIEKDFGLESLAVFQYEIDNSDELGDVENLITIFKKTVRVQEWKYRMINDIYEDIEW